MTIDYARGNDGETWLFRHGNFSAEVNRHIPSGESNLNIQCTSTIYMDTGDAKTVRDALTILIDIADTPEYAQPIRENGESLRDLCTRVATQLHDLTISATHRRLLEWRLELMRQQLDAQESAADAD